MTDRALIDHISRLPHARANFKQLVRETGRQRRHARGTGSRAGPPDRARRPDRTALRTFRRHRAQPRIRRRPPQHASRRLRLPDSRPSHRRHRRATSTSRANPPQSAMHGDRVVVRIARIEARRPRRWRDRRSAASARIPPWWASFASAGAASSWSRTTTASGNGSRFPKAWNFRPPAPAVDRVGVDAVEVHVGRRSGRHDRQRRDCSNIRRRWRPRRWAA